MAPKFRVDQVGSLMRPLELIEAQAPLQQARFQGKEPPKDAAEKVNALTKDAIRSVIKEQQDRKILPITTGEFERQFFFDGFYESLSGFESKFLPWEQFRPELPQNEPLKKWGLKGREALVATSKIKRKHSAYLNDWLFFRSCLPEEQWSNAKMTMPSPAWTHIQLNDPFNPESGYQTDEDFLSDISAALREEIMELYNAGLRNIQIDDPNLAFFCYSDWLSVLQNHGMDPTKWLDLHIKAHDDVVRNLPSDLNIGLHICRGNYKGGVHIASGGYEDIAAKLFNHTAYKTFYLEFDSPRSGDFGPLKHLPEGKAVVLGVVTTKFVEMEDLAELKKRVLAAADVIAEAGGITTQRALDCLAVSPQCGFSSDHSGAGVGMTVQAQWEKLELLQRLAEELWPGWRSPKAD